MMPIRRYAPLPQKRSRPGKLRLILLLALLSLAALDCKSTSPPAAGKSMNILLITADDLGLQVGAYGETLIQTPNIDSLAAAGAMFTTAYVAQPSCSPSRASMFTGMYVHSHGQYGITDTTGFSLHAELQNATIPNLLKQAGYKTGLIGKLHVNPESSFQFNYRPSVDARSVQDVHNKVEAFLASTGNQPFFLMVNYLDPHVFPRDANGSSFVTQVNGLPEQPLLASAATIFSWQQTNTTEQQSRTAGYYAAVQRVDAGIGLLLATLRKYNLFENTLIIFVGDNGPPFARGKTALYESGIRTPFTICWPGVTKANTVHKALVSTVDILPTILDAIGLPIPKHVQGESLRNVITDPSAPGRPYLVSEFHFHNKTPFFPQRAIRNQRYKLIHSLRAGAYIPYPLRYVDWDIAYDYSRLPEYIGTPVRTAFDVLANPPEFQLYDLDNDPDEFINLAENPLYANVLNELRTALVKWRQDTQDPFLDQAYIDLFIAFSVSP